MPVQRLTLAPDPRVALGALQAASLERPVLVFKHSPICPVSFRALDELQAFLAALDEATELGLAHVDVIAQRALARGLTAELDVRHESPQALWFLRGELAWHGSHGVLTRKRFAELVRDALPRTG